MTRHLRIALIAFCALFASAAQAQFMDYFTYVTTTLSNTIQTAFASSGPVLGYNCFNSNVYTVYVQLFDATSGVVVGTTVPVRTIPVAAGSPTGLQAPSPPFAVNNGLQVAATTASGGSTAPASAISCEFYYR